MPELRSAAAKKSTRSPELERLIRSLDQVATDLPRIMREEKATAFARFDRVEAFEAHMREMGGLPARLEELARLLDRSLQVNGSIAHLSRIFRALNNAPPGEGAARAAAEQDAGSPSLPTPRPALPVDPVTVTGSEPPVPAPPPLAAPPVVDPSTGDIVRETKSGRAFHPLDLNLDRVRNAIVPGGEICGRSMYESSRARLVTARAGGDGPWRFQFRLGSLEWAAEAEEKGMRGVAALICGDRGYVQVPARLLLKTAGSHEMRSTKGNRILRPALALYGSEAILHPGAMARTRPGEATKHVFVEF